MRSHHSHRIRPNNSNYVGEASGRSAKTPRSYEFATKVHQKSAPGRNLPGRSCSLDTTAQKPPPFAEDKPRPNTVARSFERMWRPLCHHARMGIVLSHTTAHAVYQTANSLASYAIDPIPMEKIRVSAPTTSDLETARAWLNRKNVDSECIHVLTFSNNAKRHRKGCICHCTRYTFDAESYLELEPNVYIVDIKLCALEATADLNLSELVEYYFEICGSYALETSDDTQYRERPALTSVEELKPSFQRHRDIVDPIKPLRHFLMYAKAVAPHSKRRLS